jgi:hypothetical protein
LSAITLLFAGVRSPISTRASVGSGSSTDPQRLDGLLERLAAPGIEHEPIETYSNGVRHVNVPDPDGNAIAFAEPPDADQGAA